MFYDSSQRHEMISYLIAHGVAIEDCPRNEQDLRNLVQCFANSSMRKEQLACVSKSRVFCSHSVGEVWPLFGKHFSKPRLIHELINRSFENEVKSAYSSNRGAHSLQATRHSKLILDLWQICIRFH